MLTDNPNAAWILLAEDDDSHAALMKEGTLLQQTFCRVMACSAGDTGQRRRQRASFMYLPNSPNRRLFWLKCSVFMHPVKQGQGSNLKRLGDEVKRVLEG